MTPTRRMSAAAACVVLAVVLSGCSSGFDRSRWDAPGQNVRVNGLSIVNLRLDNPGVAPAPAGGDLPLYARIVNDTEHDDALVSASSSAAGDVVLIGADGEPTGRLVVPAGGYVDLADGSAHVLLSGLEQAVRAGDYVPLSLLFERAGRVVLPAGARVEIDEEGEVAALVSSAHRFGARPDQLQA